MKTEHAALLNTRHYLLLALASVDRELSVAAGLLGEGVSDETSVNELAMLIRRARFRGVSCVKLDACLEAFTRGDRTGAYKLAGEEAPADA